MTDLVLTLIAPDRPGLVEAVAQAVADHGGNWLESRMIHLAGQFSGILRVEVPPDRAGALSKALEALASRGLRVIAAAAAREPEAAAASVARVMNLDLVGLDRPGLVREISQLLAQHGVNVEELTTDRTSAPMSGETLFRAEARVKVPADVDPTRLRQRLERLATDLTIEIRLLEDERV
ncbi:MAG TPA: ACT domain-containing protein [Polyangia bacterium]|jgi:glycine cleavage system regulatory protein|nr:ACT domain-containing protein [Polyangia bacterium]